jgi:hypothetical protein
MMRGSSDREDSALRFISSRLKFLRFEKYLEMSNEKA